MRGFAKVSRLGAALVGVVMGIGILWAEPALAAPTMTVSPTSGQAGSSFSVSGTECPEVGVAAVGRDSNANNTIEESEVLDVDGAQADGNAVWSVSLTVPSGTATGALLVEGACVVYYGDGGFEYTDATFTVTAASSTSPPPPSNTLTVSDNTVTPGQRITMQGNGFRPGSTGTAVLFSDPKVLGSGVANSAGAISLTVTIPTDTRAGPHRLELQGVDGAGAARVLATTITVSGGTLPRTGSSTPLRAVAYAGTFSVAAGLVVVAWRRMRDDPLWPI